MPQILQQLRRPMPYFTVAQGLQGLEGGLRTGMPEFSAGEAQVRLEGIN